MAYEEAAPRGKLIVAFYTLRSIRTGEEPFLDYSLTVDETEDRSVFNCGCGADVCPGTMLTAG